VTINVIDVRRQALLPHTFDVVGLNAHDATVTWDGQNLLTAGQGPIDLWDLTTGERLPPTRYEAAEGVSQLDVHPDGRLAALGETGGTIEVIDMETGELVVPLVPETPQRFDVGPRFSPDGRWLAATYFSGRVEVWDTRSWQKYRILEAAEDFAGPVWTSDSRLLVAGCTGTASIRSLDRGAGRGTILDVDPQRLEEVEVGTSDGHTIVTFTTSTGVRKWNIAPERLLEQACMVAGRNLTRQEWDDVLPGRPYQRTCLEYPSGS
jgi:hypothetical protein